MITFAKTTPPPKPLNKTTPKVALLFAGLLIVLVVLQLFKFEDFVPLIETFGINGGVTASVFASILVFAEVFALPFLLRMRVSKLMRLFSMGLGWLSAWLWAFLVGSLIVTLSTKDNELGADFPAGIAVIGAVFALVLVVLAAWSSWGMWPVATSKKSAKK